MDFQFTQEQEEFRSHSRSSENWNPESSGRLIPASAKAFLIFKMNPKVSYGLIIVLSRFTTNESRLST